MDIFWYIESQMNQANKTRAVHLCLLMITNKVLIHTGELHIAEKKLFDFIDWFDFVNWPLQKYYKGWCFEG